MVEFYDARYAHTIYGQFVTRYSLNEIRNHTKDLDLDSGIKDWYIGWEQMIYITIWIAGMSDNGID